VSAAASAPLSVASRHRRVFLVVWGALVVLAWASLWAWAASPYGRYLDHGDWMSAGPLAQLCRAVPAGEVVLPLVWVASAWVLMTTAMMLPTTLALFNSFDRLTSHRSDHALLLTMLGLGYMVAWAAFGLVAHAAHGALLALIDRVHWLTVHAWTIGVATLTLAGAFQFSALKHRCLDKCRTPLSFVMQHWRGREPVRRAFMLGLHHGVYCVGCCWALMLLMFMLGMGSLGWMLVLAALMAAEKNLSWGRRLSAPLGVVLLAWGAALAAIELAHA